MKNKEDKIINIIMIVALVACLAMSICGVVGVYGELSREPLLRAEPQPAEELVREVLAWYYEEGTVEDEQGQLWYFDDAQHEGQYWRLWIKDMGTPWDVTDDVVIDYVGG